LAHAVVHRRIRNVLRHYLTIFIYGNILQFDHYVDYSLYYYVLRIGYCSIVGHYAAKQ